MKPPNRPSDAIAYCTDHRSDQCGPSINRVQPLDPAMPRPPHVKPPAYLTPSPPVPEPEKIEPSKDDPLGEDPTRYGDWTLKGIAVDF
jgi:hypothetical protein